MSVKIEFARTYLYNTLESGITVAVRLVDNKNEVSFKAKIDTGSSHCIFERSHGEILNLDIESGEKRDFGTAIGKFIAYGHELTLEVLGLEFHTTVYFAAEEYFSRNVLGRQGWLDHLKFGLIDQEGKLFLSDLTEE